MKLHKKFSVLLTASLLAAAVYGQSNKPAIDYLNIPGPIVFDKKSYNLAWSSHPADNFYKQEYVIKGDAVNQFKTMILVDVAMGEIRIKDVVGAKVEELKKMKENNPIVNYAIYDNAKAGEYMIDFLLTAAGADGNISIAERNVYRYVSFTDKSGKKGILLFGVSTRSYGNDINPFFAALKTNKNYLVNQVAQYKIPVLQIAK